MKSQPPKHQLQHAAAGSVTSPEQIKRARKVWPALCIKVSKLLSREKGIEPEIVVGAVEEAIALATRKYYKTQENMRGELNKDTGEITAYIYKTVVADDEEIEDPVNQITLTEANELAPGVEVGSEIRLYRDTSPLGRIAAQLAKQVIFQKVREAERDTVFQEYAHREKEVLNATVKRIEGQDIIFDLGKAEARCPKREQSRLEQFSVGERVRVVLLKVDRAAKGPQVIVSRAAPELVQNLFQSEVPEIYDNTVVIRAIAREAGERTKIAVQSRDKDVDPVGACVGMKGMRVQSIIRELRGEKIDIIEFSEEITTFAEKALQPAKVSRVSITDLTREAARSDRRRYAALAGHRQEGTERPPGRQAAGLEDRHQERRGEAPGSRAADAGSHRRSFNADRAGYRAGRRHHSEAGGRRHHHGGGSGRHDAGAARRDSGHRREDAGTHQRCRAPLLRSL